MTFFDIAKPMAERGEPQIRIRPNSKAAFDQNWPALATTDLNILQTWSDETPAAGAGSVAKAQPGGFWYFEVDSREALQRMEAETGKQITDAFMVRSRAGRGHFHFRHSSASLAMGNISQSYVKGGDWSARCDNMYVISPGTLHPHTQKPYELLADVPITQAPDWLIAWLISQKIEKKQDTTVDVPRDADNKVPHGSIHGFLLSHAGRLRRMGLSAEAIEVALLEIAHSQCAAPIDESKVKTMAQSICNFPAGQPEVGLILNQGSAQVAASCDPEEIPNFEDAPYPKFPRYVFEGTSIWRNLVKPVCDVNSRIDYFMAIPAFIMLLNYVGPKIKIKGFGGPFPFRGSIYAVLVGRKGRTNKSSSVDDAMAYFNYCGLLGHAGRDTKSAEGKILTWTSGSPEGLGIEAQKTSCRNMLLVYDELSQLVAKAGIDSSGLISALLTMYESKKFSNSVKASKETFSLDPDTYCTSLIAATTDAKFAEQWSKLAGSDTGLDDRFTFILQPDFLPEPKLFQPVNTLMGSVETRRLIDKAIQQKEFEFEDRNHPMMQQLVRIENRYAARAEKWALALAIDLGLDIIDCDCIERAVDIVKYEIAVKKYLKSYEAVTREGEIQLKVSRILEMNKGRMEKRELEAKVDYRKYGLTIWKQAYGAMTGAGIIREEGGGTRSNPCYVQLLRKRDTDDE